MDKSVFSNPELTLAEKGFYATIKTFPEMSLEELRQEQNFLKVSDEDISLMIIRLRYFGYIQ